MNTQPRLVGAMHCVLIMTFLSLPSAWTAPNADPPDKMTYQGYVVDANGNALGNPNPKNYDIIFRVYNDQNAGNLIWTEQQTVTVDKGYFSILLGEGSQFASEPRPTLSSLFAATDASDRYIQMTVKGIGVGNSDSTILPRLRLLSSPYAFLAKHAVTAGSLVNSDNSQIATVSGTNITMSGTVTANSFSGFGTIPIGGIIMWSGSTVPSGWALCNGQTVNGTITPNLSGRFILASGSGTGLTTRTLGQTGGEETHLLTTNEIPSHLHSIDPPSATSSSNSHTHGMMGDYGGGVTSSGGDGVIYNADGGTRNVNIRATASDSHTHSVNIASFNSGAVGGGGAHNTMPPYYVLAFIMRVQ